MYQEIKNFDCSNYKIVNFKTVSDNSSQTMASNINTEREQAIDDSHFANDKTNTDLMMSTKKLPKKRKFDLSELDNCAKNSLCSDTNISCIINETYNSGATPVIASSPVS